MIDTGVEDREASRGDNPVGARRPALERLAQVSWLRSVLLALAIGLVLKNKPFLAPDTLFILLFLVSVTYGLAIEFLKRFLPFIGLLISYDALRGIANVVNTRVHYTPMISFDLFIARGRLPTEFLQRVLYHGKPGIFEFFLYWLYVIHFVVPVLVAVLIWRKRPDAYWQYVSAFLLLSYSAFVTFLLFPAAPPWLAAQQGFIPSLYTISADVWRALGVKDFPSVYAKFSPNPVAAVPSLHSAYPLLVALFVRKVFGRRWAGVAFLYPVMVWFGVVYMGEHYVFDVFAGILYAVIAYSLVSNLFARWELHRRGYSVGAARHVDAVVAER
jgi:hypothetical protein